MNIGIIGIRSKHFSFFRSALAALFPDGKHTVSHFWGYDAPELAANIQGVTPCATPEELICRSDAVIVATREGYTHRAFAEMAIAQAKPVFVDKPFTCSAEDARQLLLLAQNPAVRLTGGSTLCFTPQVQALQTQLPRCSTYMITYSADPFSPFGSWFFYGSHMTDLCVTLFGADWRKVHAFAQNGVVSADVLYPNFCVHIRTTPSIQPPAVTAGQTYLLDDKTCYTFGMAHFLQVAEGKIKGRTEALCASVRLMNEIVCALGQASGS